MSKKIATLRLTRIEDNKQDGTFGILTLIGEAFCVTLEPVDRENKVGISSIPTGQYTCTKFHSPKYGWTWLVRDITDRTYALFHGGNIVEHTRGCILLAQFFGKLRGNKRAVLNSGNTFRKFKRAVSKFDELHLTIVEAY